MRLIDSGSQEMDLDAMQVPYRATACIGEDPKQGHSSHGHPLRESFREVAS